MKTFALLTTAAAFSLASGMAGAVTLTNTDSDTVSLSVDSAGKKDTIKVKPGEAYDTQGKDATFVLGGNEPVSGKGADKLIIKGGKIEAEKSETTAKAEPKPAAVKPIENR